LIKKAIFRGWCHILNATSYLANSYTTSQHKKHIDIRQHFIREFIEDGILKVIFVKSEDNNEDISRKNIQISVTHLYDNDTYKNWGKMLVQGQILWVKLASDKALEGLKNQRIR
jgi:hypothetical protein